jgi:hypothetical protein
MNKELSDKLEPARYCAILGVALALAACSRAGPVPTSVKAQLTYLQQEGSYLVFSLENLSSEAIGFSGWQTPDGRITPASTAYSYNCRSSASAGAEVGLPAPDLHGPKVKTLQTGPGERTKFVIDASRFAKSRSTRCTISLIFEGGSQIDSAEFAR